MIFKIVVMVLLLLILISIWGVGSDVDVLYKYVQIRDTIKFRKDK